jgi:hypothetical protein
LFWAQQAAAVVGSKFELASFTRHATSRQASAASDARKAGAAVAAAVGHGSWSMASETSATDAG